MKPESAEAEEKKMVADRCQGQRVPPISHQQKLITRRSRTRLIRFEREEGKATRSHIGPWGGRKQLQPSRETRSFNRWYSLNFPAKGEIRRWGGEALQNSLYGRRTHRRVSNFSMTGLSTPNQSEKYEPLGWIDPGKEGKRKRKGRQKIRAKTREEKKTKK